MTIKEITAQKIWDEFLDQNPYQSFLQDFDWGEVEKKLGREIIRLGIYDTQIQNVNPQNQNANPKCKIDHILDKSGLIGICQLIGYKAKRGNFLLIPHGPVMREQIILGNRRFSHSSGESPPLPSIVFAENLFFGPSQNDLREVPENDLFAHIMREIIDYLKSQNYHKKYTFLRLNSSTPSDGVAIQKLRKIGFRFAPIYSVSENMWLKNLQKSEEELLNEMNLGHKKSILDAMKKPYLEIEATTDTSKIDDFWKIYEELAKRKEFTPYSRELIKNEFQIFSDAGKAKLYFGKVEGKIVSAALIIYSHKIAFYHHAASLPIKEPVNYKLHWQIILDAKNNGFEFYNMWGITTSQAVNHPWFGLTQFKKGFGGELIKFLPTMDHAFSKKYWLNYAIEKIRRKIRGL